MKIKIKNKSRYLMRLKFIALTGILIVTILGITKTATAQALKDIQMPKSPLVLKAQGSFYVGGETVEQSKDQLGSIELGGHLSVNQMYVRYMIPQGGERNASVVMIHGMTLTGKSWETTPDGRMGWDEYFVRNRRAVYIPDQVGRGRSGFNQAIFNDIRTGAKLPELLPSIWRISDESAFPDFRFGSKIGSPFADGQFPLDALGELAKQSIPDLTPALPTPNPTYKGLSDLAIQLKNAVLISHSQSGSFPLEAAMLNSAGIKGIVMIEPAGCPATYTDQQISTVANVPILVIFGDHLADTPTPWQATFDGCKTFVTRVNASGGKAQMLHLPEKGIRGNTHMLMQDKNNLQIADLILDWIKESVDKKNRQTKIR